MARTPSSLAFTAMTSVAALYLQQRFAVTERSIWVFFAYIAALSLLVRVTVLGALVRRLGEAVVLRSGALLLGLGLMLLPLPNGFAGLAAVLALVPVGSSLLFPCSTGLLTRHALAGETGQLLGVQQAFGGLSKILGPLVAGAAFQHLGVATPFWIAGGAVLLGLLLLGRRELASLNES